MFFDSKKAGFNNGGSKQNNKQNNKKHKTQRS